VASTSYHHIIIISWKSGLSLQSSELPWRPTPENLLFKNNIEKHRKIISEMSRLLPQSRLTTIGVGEGNLCLASQIYKIKNRKHFHVSTAHNIKQIVQTALSLCSA